MCLVHLGNLFEVFIIPVKLLNWCDELLLEESTCSTVKLFRENLFFMTILLLSKFLC